MKVRVSELQGEALNWVVEECEQFVEDEFEPSENWADGGPIIEREDNCALGVTHGRIMGRIHT
jgi:hypothetical protein